MSQTYTVKQVAEILGFSTNSIYAFLKSKRVKGVRVGKGRFRIPQAEIDRLLMTKNPSGEKAITAEKTVTPVTVETISGTDSVNITPLKPRGVRVPELSDWAIGMSLILMAIGSGLFSPLSYTSMLSGWLIWGVPVFMAGVGVLLLVTDMYSAHTSVRRAVLLLAATALSIAGVLYFRLENAEGAVLMGSMATGAVVTALVPGSSGYAIAGMLYLFLIGISFTFATGTGLMVRKLNIMFPGLPEHALGAAWFLGTTLLAAVTLIGIRGNRRIWWFVSSLASGVALCLAVVFVQALAWPLAITLTVLSVVGLFVPVWDVFSFRIQSDRKIVFVTFSLVIFVLSTYIGGVRLLERSIVRYAMREADRKSIFVAELVGARLEGAVETIVSGSDNPEFITALTSPKKTDAQQTLRALFDGKQEFRMLYLVSKSGAVLSSYPFTDSDVQQDITELFPQLLDRSDTFVGSEIITREGGRMGLGIAHRIKSDDGDTTGYLAGEYDISSLAVRLYQLSDDIQDEFIAVADKTGREILHADITNPSAFESFLGETGRFADLKSPGVSVSPDRLPFIIASHEIPDRAWVAFVGVPVASVFRETTAPTLGLFVVFVLFIVFAVFLFTARRLHSFLDHSP